LLSTRKAAPYPQHRVAKNEKDNARHERPQRHNPSSIRVAAPSLIPKLPSDVFPISIVVIRVHVYAATIRHFHCHNLWIVIKIPFPLPIHSKERDAQLLRGRRSHYFIERLAVVDLPRIQASLGFPMRLKTPPHRAASLRGANLNEADLRKADLRGAILDEAKLSAANLSEANLVAASLRGADLKGAELNEAYLVAAKLGKANLGGADLRGADLRTDFSGADLVGSNLESTRLVETNLTDSDLTGCRVYGVSAWNLKLERAKQQNLVISPSVPIEQPENTITPYKNAEPEITVDNIEVAQFIYLLLHNEKIRDVIDTIGKKGVLLLGRFTEGRMLILERLREKLRNLGFLPMVFNFDKPETKDFTETIRLLTTLSRFVIVDITNPRSTPLELQATVPDYMVPFVPILEEGQDVFAMFVDLQNKYDWVLEPVIVYSSVDRLLEVFEDKIVRRAEAKFNQLLARRTKQLRVENV